MSRRRLQKAINSPANLRFGEFTALVESFGFRLSRTSGGHYIYVHPNVRELVNMQNVGGKAKPYQVRQFLRIVERFNLTLPEN
jgi:predicted RNA binding protein YcfA (HicA-like mRNA interferase family)